MRSLVVYYSLTGKTSLVAQAIAETLDARLVEIKEAKTRRPGLALYLTGGFAAFANRGSSINPMEVDLKQYDRVFIGSPVWASRPTPAVNSFIYRADFRGRHVIPFFTLGGADAQQALANITAKIEKSHGKVAGSLAVTSNNVSDEELIARAREAASQYSA